MWAVSANAQDHKDRGVLVFEAVLEVDPVGSMATPRAAHLD